MKMIEIDALKGFYFEKESVSINYFEEKRFFFLVEICLSFCPALSAFNRESTNRIFLNPLLNLNIRYLQCPSQQDPVPKAPPADQVHRHGPRMPGRRRHVGCVSKCAVRVDRAGYTGNHVLYTAHEDDTDAKSHGEWKGWRDGGGRVYP